MAVENRAASSKQKRRRLDPEDREREIIDGAVGFFAEVGFDGGLRDLAKRLGITHQNLFRYFPTKEALIDRVYEEVYLGRWQVEWEVLLADRTIALEQRLMQFYRSYLQAIFRYDWVRIFVFAGLKGVGITQRYLELVQARVVEPLARELRAATGLPDTSEVPLLPEETELAWGLHGELFYLAVRRWVYDMKVPDDLDMVVRVAVVKFLAGAPSAVRLLHEDTVRTPAPQPGRRARPARRNPR
ncbi:MAG: TetR/AcrR family transcriptional regulator [Acetobacter fabarum]|jgi:AcrR family transcriptional regulator|uniref:TetR/AcrR family transcriptional regulator n=1 Tax=Acetobacter fabarum TaxID=483199 RepID=UPI0024312275|nr:TetR/AcrR family transcriptional regulator [Acetobacter fabarum]MCH4024718.1 TetR/AcrR family transcriptional regulator [Acetobacter fabarum]MCH4084840.1 TetR/AcrR family transcriptional regulator [Acetobacter fabarum]MCH4137917.1 TetR/AcrR family transcriptional regulator [Acetobacter fabarum]